jgi:DNA repair protein RadD
MSFVLRDYQQEAVNSIFAHFRAGGMAPLVVMPTGSGKSAVLSEIIRDAMCEKGAKKVLVLVDSKELVAQNEKTLKRVWPEAKTGIYSAGLSRRDLNAPVLFAGIQSIYKRAFDLGKVDIIIIDECHMIPRDAHTRYGKFLKDISLANPNVCLIGLTATPYRLDTGSLIDGSDALFDDIVYDTDINKLIEAGYLAPVVCKGSANKIDLDKVHVRMGEYAPGELAEAADKEKLIKGAVDEIVKYGKDRQSWIVFCAGIDHAKHVLEEIRSRGVIAELVTGNTDRKERDRIVEDFKHRRIKCLVNVSVFQKGFDAPCIDLLALLTATRSPGRYVQVVGRAMRTCPGKENAIILDMGTNIERMGPIDAITPPKAKIKGEGDGVAPCKECPQCFEIVPASARFCPACYHEFEQKPAHESTAYDGAVLSKQEEPVWWIVEEVGAFRHKKAGKPDSIKMEFHCIGREFPFCQWLALDHGGYATNKAKEYINAAGGVAACVDDAMREYFVWKDPTRIQVKRDGKYWRIVSFDFPDDLNTKQVELVP